MARPQTTVTMQRFADVHDDQPWAEVRLTLTQMQDNGDTIELSAVSNEHDPATGTVVDSIGPVPVTIHESDPMRQIINLALVRIAQAAQERGIAITS